MKLALYSDLHLALVPHQKDSLLWDPPELDVDVAIFDGDIGSRTHGLEWTARAFSLTSGPEVPVSPDIVYVAGNHKYYGAQLDLLNEFQKSFWEQLGVHFQERRSLEFVATNLTI